MMFLFKEHVVWPLRRWWAKKKYELHCKLGHHITYDMHYKAKQVWVDKSKLLDFSSGRPFDHVLISKRPVPIMNCRRCEKRVNVGLPDEYFHGDRNIYGHHTN